MLIAILNPSEWVESLAVFVDASMRRDRPYAANPVDLMAQVTVSPRRSTRSRGCPCRRAPRPRSVRSPATTRPPGQRPSSASARTLHAPGTRRRPSPTRYGSRRSRRARVRLRPDPVLADQVGNRHPILNGDHLDLAQPRPRHRRRPVPVRLRRFRPPLRQFLLRICTSCGYPGRSQSRCPAEMPSSFLWSGCPGAPDPRMSHRVAYSPTRRST